MKLLQKKIDGSSCAVTSTSWILCHNCPAPELHIFIKFVRSFSAGTLHIFSCIYKLHHIFIWDHVQSTPAVDTNSQIHLVNAMIQHPQSHHLNGLASLKGSMALAFPPLTQGNLVTCNTLINACTKSQRWEAACAVLATGRTHHATSFPTRGWSSPEQA